VAVTCPRFSDVPDACALQAALMGAKLQPASGREASRLVPVFMPLHVRCAMAFSAHAYPQHQHTCAARSMLAPRMRNA
jgi:hypothetical protein